MGRVGRHNDLPGSPRRSTRGSRWSHSLVVLRAASDDCSPCDMSCTNLSYHAHHAFSDSPRAEKNLKCHPGGCNCTRVPELSRPSLTAPLADSLCSGAGATHPSHPSHTSTRSTTPQPFQQLPKYETPIHTKNSEALSCDSLDDGCPHCPCGERSPFICPFLTALPTASPHLPPRAATLPKSTAGSRRGSSRKNKNKCGSTPKKDTGGAAAFPAGAHRQPCNRVLARPNAHDEDGGPTREFGHATRRHCSLQGGRLARPPS